MSEEFEIGDIVRYSGKVKILGEVISLSADKSWNILRPDGSVVQVDPAHITKFKDAFDPVEKPRHYNIHPSGVEIIQITEHMNFCLGNAIKYICRSGIKTEDPIEDLKKARWYLEREIERIEKQLAVKHGVYL